MSYSERVKKINQISIIVALLAIITVMLRWRYVPDMVPAHFDLWGNITRHDAKGLLAVFVGIIPVVLLPLLFAGNFVLKSNNSLYMNSYKKSHFRHAKESEMEEYKGETALLLSEIALVIVIFFAYVTYCIMDNSSLARLATPFFVMTLLLITIKRNIFLFKISSQIKKRINDKE